MKFNQRLKGLNRFIDDTEADKPDKYAADDSDDDSLMFRLPRFKPR